MLRRVRRYIRPALVDSFMNAGDRGHIENAAAKRLATASAADGLVLGEKGVGDGESRARH